MDPLKRAEERHDGRNIDPELGTLMGEASVQRAREVEAHPGRRSYEDIANDSAAREEGTSYYGLPVLAEPVWRWMIPAYFFVGGLAGASAVLGGAVQLAERDRGKRADLVRRCRFISVAGSAVSAALLIADLGRPSRFLNMLRVFRPTSPMNMGTWVLTGFGACSSAALVPELLSLPAFPRRMTLSASRSWLQATPRQRWDMRPWRRRAPRRLMARAGDVAGYGAALFGLPLVGYTGVLLANTAVPIWQQTRNTLPVLFAFSGAVSAGALFDVWPPARGGGVAHRFGLLARGAELAVSTALDLEAGPGTRVGRPLRHGVSGAMMHAARAMLIASLAAEVLPLPRRTKRFAAGLLALGGTLAMRFGIVQAGHASARDPHATFEMQRSGRGAAEVGAKLRRWARTAQMPTIPGVDATGRESVQHGAGP